MNKRYSLHDFWDFGLKQFQSAIFGITIILSLAVTEIIHIPAISRYDLMFIIVVLIQLVLLVTRYEQPFDLIPIMVFHILGMLLEIFKVHQGSWSYPGAGFLKIASVPLYSAFMYSAIGSYIVRAIKVFDLQAKNWPKIGWTLLSATLIYLNFFTDTFHFDYRIVLYLLIMIAFWRTKFTFVLRERRHEMPAILSFFLIGLFIYFAENIGSYFSAWRYSYQLSHWRLVDAGKISSWSLLIIVSIILVIELQRYFSKKLTVKNIIQN
ncbi:DUF817 family protein [Lactococcus nasutitermitis]|uniref:DUF817 family protein n=1 Tax=Lactococcus nasutitermitis TaxID=1652957 RepID=A0ABV9JBD9_9LACT|nr:DUF817 family protein [Lactococcus nasutitermitis]